MQRNTIAELLSEHENAQESESCLAKSNTSTQETGAASDPSSMKLDAEPSQLFSQPSVLHTKNHTNDGKEVENYSCPFIVQRRISFHSDLQNGSTIAAS